MRGGELEGGIGSLNDKDTTYPGRKILVVRTRYIETRFIDLPKFS